MKECVLWLRGSSAFISRWLETALLYPCDLLGAPLMMQLRWWPIPLGEEELCHTAQPLKAAVPASSSSVSCPGTRSLSEDKVPAPHLPSLTPGCVLTWRSSTLPTLMWALLLALSLPCPCGLPPRSSWPGHRLPLSLFCLPIVAEASSQPVTMSPPC